MASFSPVPSFYLCPDFSIAPPPNGHLQLGTVLRGLDIDSVLSPLNIGDTIEIPPTHLQPRDGPAEKAGFSRSLKDLRGLEASIWAKVFGSKGVGASFLRNRKDDETLTVEKLFVQYFIPTSEYMKKTLEVDGVALYVNVTKRTEPIYLITGVMWTEGAKLSKIRSKKNKASGNITAAQLNSGIALGGGASHENEESISSSFDGSTPFILGIRVRKIWWDKSGIRRDAEEIVGATLASSEASSEEMLDGLMFVDDEDQIEPDQTVINENETGEEHPVKWIVA
ncbi:hypothetical protein E8E14_007633 [Neopestalotiopsis sp. 37M]|nr:hypothetical protein E8E14_007633 [Neopestalotiopsis sp. 37M]